jgi:NADPH-dependent glutamate synthase beta subunit-like oxidoreductase
MTPPDDPAERQVRSAGMSTSLVVGSGPDGLAPAVALAKAGVAVAPHQSDRDIAHRTNR